uniref:Lipoprotein n=1 Tax=Thermocrinis ruber TaxID=75906 RepID=A0A7C5X4G5_9AQUI
MRLGRVFSLVLLAFAFSCASKQDLVKEIKSSSYVIESFYKGGVVERKPMSTKEWESAVQGSYEDKIGFVGRTKIKVRVKDEEKLGDF